MTITILRRTIMGTFAACMLVGTACAQSKKQSPGNQPILLGQFGDWAAYELAPGGKKTCFALSQPVSAVTEPPGRSRDSSYVFVSTRPAEKTKNEVSVVVGYPQKSGQEAMAVIGSARYVLYTQNNGAWVKDLAEQPQLVEAMRKGANLIITSESSHGTKTTDIYSLKGISQALDKVAEACK